MIFNMTGGGGGNGLAENPYLLYQGVETINANAGWFGWQAIAKQFDSSAASAKVPTITQDPGTDTSFSINKGAGLYTTTNVLDLSKYSTVEIKINTSVNKRLTFGVMANTETVTYYYANLLVYYDNYDTGDQTITLDISSIDEGQIVMGASNAAGASSFTVEYVQLKR